MCEGPEPGALLAAVQAVPAQRQLQPAAGGLLTLGHRVTRDSGALMLTHAATRLAGLRLDMTVSRVEGIAAELELRDDPGTVLQLPEDLLAVLGLPWSRLSRAGHAWRGSIVLRGSGERRTRDAEAKLARTAVHLAQTLAEPPARFHARWQRKRWGVVLRRLTPLLVAVGLIVAALLVPRLNLGADSVVRMLIFNSPPLLLVWLFTMREMPRLEIPPLPRPSTAPDWRAAPASVPSAPTETTR